MGLSPIDSLLNGPEPAKVTGTAPLLSPQQSGLLNQSIGQTGSALGGMNLDLNQNPAYQSALSTVDRTSQPFDAGRYRDMYEKTIQEPVLRNFLQHARPQTVATNSFGSGGRNSSALDLALSGAQSDLYSNLASMQERSVNSAYESSLDRNLRSASLQSEFAQSPMRSILPFLNLNVNTRAEDPIIQGPGTDYPAMFAQLAIKSMFTGSK